MGIANKAGLFLILSLSILLSTALLKTDLVSSAEDALSGSEASGTEASAALFRLELRSGPSADHPILCVIPEGAAVQYLHAAPNGWSFVSHEGQSGYLPDKKTADSLEEARNQRGKTRSRGISKKLRLRRRPKRHLFLDPFRMVRGTRFNQIPQPCITPSMTWSSLMGRAAAGQGSL